MTTDSQMQKVRLMLKQRRILAATGKRSASQERES